jgi:hypothetical protein
MAIRVQKRKKCDEGEKKAGMNVLWINMIESQWKMVQPPVPET